MYHTLTWIAAGIGLFITIGAVAGIIYIFWPSRKTTADSEATEQLRLARLSKLFMRWTWFDYVVVVVFLCGAAFLIVDLAAVIRDSERYPFYHYGYLASGLIFTVLSMLLMFLRLGTLIALSKAQRTSSDAPLHQHGEPTQTEQAEHRV